MSEAELPSLEETIVEVTTPCEHRVRRWRIGHHRNLQREWVSYGVCLDCKDLVLSVHSEVYIIVDGSGPGPGVEFVEIETPEGEGVSVPWEPYRPEGGGELAGELHRIGPLYLQPTRPPSEAQVSAAAERAATYLENVAYTIELLSRDKWLNARAIAGRGYEEPRIPDWKRLRELAERIREGAKERAQSIEDLGLLEGKQQFTR